MGKFYITTAIPYVNAAPHLGHVLEFIQTDVIARYQKLRGKEVALVYDGYMERGQKYTGTVDASALPTGVYYYRLQQGSLAVQKALTITR